MEPDEGYFGEQVAAAYDEDSASMFDPAVLRLRRGHAAPERAAEPFTALSPAHVSVYEKL